MRTKLAILTVIMCIVIGSLPTSYSANAQQATAEATIEETAASTTVATAVGTASATASPTSAATTAGSSSGWMVKSSDTIPFAGGSVYLSPDGKSILTLHAGQLCTIAVADKTQRCINQADSPLVAAPYSVAWSPDSQSVALSDDFLRLFVTSYIWVLNTKTMQLKNLTGDGNPHRFSLTHPASNFKVDIAPHWSTDGKTLYFLRCEAPCAAKQPAMLYSLDLTAADPGSTAQKIASLNQPFVWVLNFDVAKDGKSIVYLVSKSDKQYPLDGVWQLTLADGTSKHLAVVHKLINVQFSADNAYVLAYNPSVEEALPTLQSIHRILNLANTQATMIDPTRFGYYPGWGPIGAEYAYLTQDQSQNKDSLYIVDKPGDVGQLVYSTDKRILPSAQEGWRGVQWAQDNTILVLRDLNITLLVVA